MNLINTAIIQNLSNLSNWVDSTPTPQVIDTVTYDLYETSNPFRRTFDKGDISNKGLRIAVNTTTSVGAEVFSAFANPYYITHKIIQVPMAYKAVVDTYKKYTQK